MRLSPEAVYRNHLSDNPECLTTALDMVIPSSPTGDSAVTRLTRQLCFEPARLDETTLPPLCEQLPQIVDHGLRQVALAETVLTDPAIQDRLPGWFDSGLFSHVLLAADVGLAFVPHDEVLRIHQNGPKSAEFYTRHPEYGYQMASALSQPGNEQSQMLALLIARHHATQAKHSYGLTWQQIGSQEINPDRIDLTILLQKAFDYFDDFFGRPTTGTRDFVAQARAPLERFSATYDELLSANPELVHQMQQNGFDTTLPKFISAAILETVIDPQSAVGAVYRGHRPDLASSHSR